METDIYTWSDREERLYATLRRRGGHWRLEWGYRSPPRSDKRAQQGDLETSDPEEAIRAMLEHIGELSGDPDEPVRVERKLREAVSASERQ